MNSANAADMPIKARPLPVAAAYSWTGWYVGANAGYGFSSNTTNFFGLDAGGLTRMDLLTPQLSENRNGFLGGFQVGVNNQSGNIVYGLEADLDAGQIKGSSSGPPITIVVPVFIVTSTETKLNWLGTVRGRLGFAADRSLFYATGGLAYGSATSSPNVTEFNNGACTLGANLCLASSTRKTMFGWTLGGGWEYAFAGQWSAKVEYLYYDLGKIDNIMTPLNGAPAITFGSSTRINGNIVRLGLNYKLGGI
jgi:outer membrane immunogenic protein